MRWFGGIGAHKKSRIMERPEGGRKQVGCEEGKEKIWEEGGEGGGKKLKGVHRRRLGKLET